jgi:predicted transposase YbfD/YdcC
MDLSTFDEGAQFSQGSLAIDPASLYREFEKVKDGRGEKGRRFPLPFVLTLIMLGKMAGQKKISGIIDWVKEREISLRKLLNWPKDFPVHSTYDDVLAKCDEQGLIKAIESVIRKARAKDKCGDETNRLVAEASEGDNLVHRAADGKVMKGTLKHTNEDMPPVHLVGLYECETGILVAQVEVKSKENEKSAGKILLDPIYVKGCIITSDAMFSFREWCTKIHIYNGYYNTIIKDNNPVVHRELEEFFGDDGIDRSEWQYHKKVQKGHGRLEVREIWTSTQMNDYYAKDWTGIAQVFMIRRTVREKGEERIQIVYGITNLPRKKANAQRILELNQKHWSVENCLHYRRDVTLGEDASQVRIKGAPETLAVINSGILALMDYLGVKNVTRMMRHFDAQYHEALQLLLGRLKRQGG